MSYKMRYKTLYGGECSVELSPSGGGTGELTASSEAFEMEREENIEVGSVLCATTGTLRFVVLEGEESVVDAVIPQTLAGTRVEVRLAEAGSEEGECKFLGYVELTEYSQAWDSAPYEMELPVRDAISMMDEVRVAVGTGGGLCEVLNVAGVIVEAFESVGIEPEGLYYEGVRPGLFLLKLQREWLMDEETSEEGGETSVAMVGKLWSDALEQVLLPLGVEMWMEGGKVRVVSKSVSGVYRYYTWEELRSMAAGEEVSGVEGNIDVCAMEGVLTNMSASNERGYLPGVGRVLLKESKEEASVFELRDEYISWELVSMQYNSSGDTVWERHGETSQRGVTLNRGYIDEGLVWHAMGWRTAVSYESGGRPVYGGVLCDLSGYKSEDAAEEDAMPQCGGAAVVFPVMNCREYNVGTGDVQSIGEGVAVIDFTCPVLVDTRKSGCLCLSASLRLSDAGTSGPYYAVGVAETKDTGTWLLGQIMLESQEGGGRWWLSGAYGSARQWVRSAENPGVYVYLMFDGSGNIVMNADGRRVQIAYRQSGADRTTGMTYVGAGESISSRFRYDDIEGYLIPMDGVPAAGSEGLYSVRVLLYSLADYSAGDRDWVEMIAHRLMDHDGRRYLESLSDLKVTWSGEVVDGEIPEPGEDASGSYRLACKSLPSDRTHVCLYKGTLGGDAEVEVSTWGDGDGLKWGDTLQPDLLDRDAWDAASKQYVSRRRTVEYEDARLSVCVPCYYSVGGMTLRQAGGVWQSWNEGGRKKFVETL